MTSQHKEFLRFHNNITSLCNLSVLFLKKCRATDVPKLLITKNDCRLLINFGPVIQLIKNITSPMNMTYDLCIQPGCWKEIIVLDLYSAFYQNYMYPDSKQYYWNYDSL